MYNIEQIKLLAEQLFDEPEPIIGDSRVVMLDHNYAGEEIFVYDADLKDMVPEILFNPQRMCPCRTFNSKMLDTFCFVDSSYYNDIASSYVSECFYNNLQRSNACLKRGVFVVMNTDLQRSKR